MSSTQKGAEGIEPNGPLDNKPMNPHLLDDRDVKEDPKKKSAYEIFSERTLKQNIVADRRTITELQKQNQTKKITKILAITKKVAAEITVNIKT